MEDQTIKLLKECSSGCKMAVKSIRQVKEYADEKLERILDAYDKKHRDLDGETDQLLDEYGKTMEEPSIMATAFAWMETEMKLLVHGDDHQIAKLMMDGCNMGIQKISEYINKFTNASQKSMELAQKLVKVEEDFMEEMKAFV